MSEPLPPTFQSRLHSESDFPAEFVRLHLHRVFTLIFRIVGDRDETQELTQETFIKVFQRKGASTDLRKAAAALPAIAAITAVQWLRQNEPRQAGFRFADLAPLGPQSSSRDLRAALDLLSPQERATFLLCDIEGIDIVEIARYTNDSAAAIRASIAQARTKLRQHLQAEERL